jgi:hypothetical protein
MENAKKKEQEEIKVKSTWIKEHREKRKVRKMNKERNIFYVVSIPALFTKS